MGQLTIRFSGIMTHFYDCIPFDSIMPKIPMRSVIPDTLGVNVGFVRRHQIEGGAEIYPQLLGYYLMPHLAVISDAKDVNADGSHWIPLLGLHMQVANPAQAPFTPPPPEDGYSLREYAPEIKISKEVVQKGNASGYFDLYSGTATVLGDKNVPTDSLSTQVVIEIEDDVPRLKITPFDDSPLTLADYPFLKLRDNIYQWPLPNGELYVSNIDVASFTDDAAIEFLLNYLVAEGGVPKAIARNTPGMGNRLNPLTLELLGNRLQALGWIIQSSPMVALTPASRFAPIPGQGPEAIELSGLAEGILSRELTIDALYNAVFSQGPVPLDQSCSDSRYP